MAGKKMEGDAAMRRKKAREARRRGSSASAESATQGSSKQRKTLGRSDDHLEKLESIRSGKQRSAMQGTAEPSPRSRGARRRGVRSQ